MSAKSIFTKILGTITLTVGIIYFVFPNVFLSILGLEITGGELAVASLLIRLIATHNVLIGIGMLISSRKLENHFWLIIFVFTSFADAIAALLISGLPAHILPAGTTVRFLAPLWITAIGLLFFTGVAYGLDLAGVFKKDKKDAISDVLTTAEIAPVNQKVEAEEVKH